jgi:hypothetical protein
MGQKPKSPAGAAEFPATILSAAPPGLDLLDGFYPQLKLRAILGCPCGTKSRRRTPRVKKTGAVREIQTADPVARNHPADDEIVHRITSLFYHTRNKCPASNWYNILYPRSVENLLIQHKFHNNR